MRQVRYAVVALTLAVGACDPKPAANTPTRAETTPQLSSDDETQIRRVIDAFLPARWSYDATGAFEHLSAIDREKMEVAAFMDPAQFLPAMLVPNSAPGAHHSWKVGEVVALDRDHARVVVHLAFPDPAAIMSARMRTLTNANRGGGKHLLEVMKGKVEGATPDRALIEVDYKVVREEGQWRVFMGWDARREEIASGTFDPARFEGSEGAILALRAEEQELTQKATPGDPKLVEAVWDAERAVRDERFDVALEQYAQIRQGQDLPRFIVERIAWIERRAKQVQERDGLPENSFFHDDFKAYETGKQSAPTPSADGRAVRALAGELRACEGWPEEPTDLAVTIDASGQFQSVQFWAAPAADALSRCVESVLEAGRYPRGRPRTTLVELTPPPRRGP